MKKQFALRSFVFLFFVANINTSMASPQGFYFGGGMSEVDIDGRSSDLVKSNPKNYFLSAGYQLTENYAVELNYSKSLKRSASISYKDKAESDVYYPNTPYNFALNARVSSSLDSTAIYGVYRSAGEHYVKAKLGYISTNLKTSYVRTGDAGPGQTTYYSFSEQVKGDGFAGGIGVGHKFNVGEIELEYTKTKDTPRGMELVSLGYNHYF